MLTVHPLRISLFNNVWRILYHVPFYCRHIQYRIRETLKRDRNLELSGFHGPTSHSRKKRPRDTSRQGSAHAAPGISPFIESFVKSSQELIFPLRLDCRRCFGFGDFNEEKTFCAWRHSRRREIETHGADFEMVG